MPSANAPPATAPPATAPPGPARGAAPLGPRQLAFVRAWAEGVDPTVAWLRFLANDGSAAGDARRARGDLQRLLDALRALARAHGRPDIAVLLQRDPAAMADTGPAVPTLEDFAASQPADFYSESELIALYDATHGRAQARSAARRRQRLRARLVAAIQWLEGVGARAPRPADAVAAWLDARVAARLAAAGIRTLDDLQRWIVRRGLHWHRGIPRLGAQGAARLLRWLGDHAATLGPVPATALAPPRADGVQPVAPAPRTGIVPLERFVAPAGLDGAQGRNRAPASLCRIDAAGDVGAVQAWLQTRAPATHTGRASRREAERFLLWAVLQRGRPLSSLDGADCAAYRRFLAAPGAGWTGPRGALRGSDAWRPFEGPLSPRSQVAALSLLRSLCDWLVHQGYLAINPWRAVPAADAAPAADATTLAAPPLPPSGTAASSPRAFSPQEWALVRRWIDGELRRVPTPARHRLQFLLGFGVGTGLRLSELAAARLGWVRPPVLDGSTGGGPPGWSLRVPGRGATWRDVPLPDAALQALRGHLARRGLPPDPRDNGADTPLLAHLAAERPLSAARIHDILRDGFARCAESVAATDARTAARIRRASSHWLRQTGRTWADADAAR